LASESEAGGGGEFLPSGPTIGQFFVSRAAMAWWRPGVWNAVNCRVRGAALRPLNVSKLPSTADNLYFVGTI
jgi:hypothetical protein